MPGDSATLHLEFWGPSPTGAKVRASGVSKVLPWQQPVLRTQDCEPRLGSLAAMLETGIPGHQQGRAAPLYRPRAKFSL